MKGKPGLPRSAEFCEARAVVDLLGTTSLDLIITDERLAELYLVGLDPDRMLLLPPGEDGKDLRWAVEAWDRMIALGMDRSSRVLGFGGGSICDLAGFAAGTFMRGTGLWLLPTTLLAQVDAALGGKNGFDYKGVKNLIGSFRHPDKILLDPSLLGTLDQDQVVGGFAEVIKYGAIRDRGLLKLLSDNREMLLDLEPGLLEECIAACLRHKQGVVDDDPLDNGPRRILNFGHTLAHGVEAVTRMAHGPAVALGMRGELRISRDLRVLADWEVAYMDRLLDGFGLPSVAPCSFKELLPYVDRDKKNLGPNIDFPILHGLGEGMVVRMDRSEVISRMEKAWLELGAPA